MHLYHSKRGYTDKIAVLKYADIRLILDAVLLSIRHPHKWFGGSGGLLSPKTHTVTPESEGTNTLVNL